MVYSVHQRCTMSVTSLYDLYGSDIQKLFSSAISVKILLLLAGNERTVAEVCAETGHVHPAVMPRVRQLEALGLITQTDESYALTTLGTVLAGKIASLFSIPDGLPGDDTPSPEDAGEVLLRARSAPLHPSVVLDRYAAHMKEINLVLRSGIRTRMFLALLDGRTDRGLLRGVTGCCSSNFRANMRGLIGAGLIREHADGVVLTPRGEALASSVAEIVPVYGLIIRHRDFWREHSLRNLPEFALGSIGALVESEIIRDSSVEYFQTYEHYLSIVAGAKQIHGITSLANPGVAAAIAARVVEGIPAEIVVPPELALRLYEEPYREKVEFLSMFPHFKFHVTDLPIPPGITVTDAYLSMKLFLAGTTTYDLLNGFVATSPAALAWGERLFAYYREHSVSIGEFLDGREGGE
jgi:predicted transcriptional regulator